jgi:sensor c-di-GMP phosphodiesterase-like protein
MPSQAFLNSNWLAIGISALAQLVLFLRWLYRHIRNEDVNRAFVEDMATNHLPHIYDLLVKLADRQGIAHEAPPPIRWIDLSNHHHSRR